MAECMREQRYLAYKYLPYVLYDIVCQCFIVSNAETALQKLIPVCFNTVRTLLSRLQVGHVCVLYDFARPCIFRFVYKIPYRHVPRFAECVPRAKVSCIRYFVMRKKCAWVGYNPTSVCANHALHTRPSARHDRVYCIQYSNARAKVAYLKGKYLYLRYFRVRHL